MSISQIGNAAIREYVGRLIKEDAAFRALVLAMETTPGSLADRELGKLRKAT